MKILSLIFGILGVVLYLLCFQLKHAKSIIACRVLSSLFYVLQYLLLFAFVGAAMDAAALVTSYIAYRRDTAFVKRHKIPILILTNAAIVTVGILLYTSPISLLAVAGVLFESASNWMKKEKTIRLVSLPAVPCWLIYNLAAGAYGAAIGSFLALLSLISAMIRYSAAEKAEKQKAAPPTTTEV